MNVNFFWYFLYVQCLSHLITLFLIQHPFSDTHFSLSYSMIYQCHFFFIIHLTFIYTPFL
jgi:hypothetical protein